MHQTLPDTTPAPRQHLLSQLIYTVVMMSLCCHPVVGQLKPNLGTSCGPLQCGLVMKLHMLNPLTTREFTAKKLEESPDAPGEPETSERWLTMAVCSLQCCLFHSALSSLSFTVVRASLTAAASEELLSSVKAALLALGLQG